MILDAFHLMPDDCVEPAAKPLAVGIAGETAKGFDLGSATRVVTSANELWLVYSAQTGRWKEVLFE